MVYNEKNKSKWTKDGRHWYFRCYYTDENEKRKQKQSGMYKTSQEAQKAEYEFLKKQKKSNKDNIKESYILDDIFCEYEEFISSKKNKDTSNYSDYLNYKNHISPSLGEINIKEITIYDIRKFHIYLNNSTFTRNGENISYSTKFKQKIHSLLCCILDYAVSMGYIEENMARRHGNFKSQRQEVSTKSDQEYYQTPAEFEQFINVVDDLQWKSFFSFLYWTGCRKGEVQALTWEDIDFDNNLIRINKTLANKIKGGGYKITNTKNRRTRTIAIFPQSKPILMEWYKENQKYKNFSNKWFVWGQERFLPNTSIDNYKNKYYDIVHIDHPDNMYLTAHQFGRHSHASLLISLGVSLEHIAERLGDTPEVIRKTYAHLFPSYNDDILQIATQENINAINDKMSKYKKIFQN